MNWLIALILILPGLTRQDQSGQKIYPLDHMRGVFITNLILQFLYNNQSTPFSRLSFYDSTAQILNNQNYCQFCRKQFTNASYLALHYSVMHQKQLFEPFKPYDTPSFQILFNPYSSLPQQQIYLECISFYNRLKDRLLRQKSNFGKHFHYLRDHVGTQFCEIVANKFYEQGIEERIVQVVGFSMVIVGVIGYTLYSLESRKMEAHRKKSKNY